MTDSIQPPSAISIEPNEPIIEILQSEESNKSLPTTPDFISQKEVDVNTEEKPSQLDLNVVPTTEIPLEIEAPPPDLDVVTEDPLASVSVDQTVTENVDLLKDEVLSNKDQFEDTGSVVEQQAPADTGILGGLKNILPMFGGGGGVKSDETEQPAAENVLNEVVDQKIDVESNTVEQIVKTDTENKIENELSSEIQELQDANQVKPDESIEVKNEPIEVGADEKPLIEDTLKEDKLEDSQSTDEGFLTGLQSFFGFGSVSTNDEINPSQTIAAADYLYSSLVSDTPVYVFLRCFKCKCLINRQMSIQTLLVRLILQLKRQ